MKTLFFFFQGYAILFYLFFIFTFYLINFNIYQGRLRALLVLKGFSLLAIVFGLISLLSVIFCWVTGSDAFGLIPLADGLFPLELILFFAYLLSIRMGIQIFRMAMILRNSSIRVKRKILRIRIIAV